MGKLKREYKGKAVQNDAATSPAPYSRMPPPSTPTTTADESSSTHDELDAADAAVDDTADVTRDGRIAVNLDTKLGHLFAQLMQAAEADLESPGVEPPPPYAEATQSDHWPLPLSIVVQVVGSRGDVQPFIALGNELQRHGHRVRLATHAVFEDFVTDAGLEFYPIGGDPSELMAYMVKNPGLMPTMSSLREGEIGKKREMIAEILAGCWSSCISPDPVTQEPFVANAIIANPPSFAHVHCAEALGVPLHIVFTMPWSPTRSFPHPLANVKNTTTDRRLANFVSYGMVQLLTWNGTSDIVQRWRTSIDLEPLPAFEAPFLLDTQKIPHTYCWSPALVPKPKDWGPHIDVCGFLFRQVDEYTPPSALVNFLELGPPPIYVGFGSIVSPDPEELLDIVLEAVKICGVRAIISKGWNNFERIDASQEVFFLGDCPHEWLFQKVFAVVHHGGAGTTACGLLNARPTTIIPFFGDQPFWGDMVASARAGPRPIPFKKLNIHNLSEAIKYCMTNEALQAAAAVADRMRTEDGVKAAINSFHRNLPLKDMQCDLIPELPAVWQYTRGKRPIKLSGAALETLLRFSKIKENDVTVYKPKPIHVENRRWDLITSSISSTLGLSYDILESLSGIGLKPRQIYKNKEKEKARAKALAVTEGSSVSHQPELVHNNEKSPRDLGKMIGSSAMSLVQLHGVVIKGALADVPVAVTEGLRNTPKLYGEGVPDLEPVTDWKSGLSVAGSNFTRQMGEGLTDIFVQPVKGLYKEGAVGLGKGVARGTVQTATKPAAAVLGLVGYTSQGIYKSLRNTFRSKTRESLASAGRVRDKYFLHAKGATIDPADVLNRFTILTEKTNKSMTNAENGLTTPPTSLGRTNLPDEEQQEALVSSRRMGLPTSLDISLVDPPPWSQAMAFQPANSTPDADAFLNVLAEQPWVGSQEPVLDLAPNTYLPPAPDSSIDLGSTASSHTGDDQQPATVPVQTPLRVRRRSNPELPAYI
ncbi:hypothetical protein B0A52_05168 [Exophiala mesophila]|uniref:Glycosyltransferase family 28 N-terminal domain-containing protein n=1 Tax=Exophiala mesophila TaxID=212818 RepID=A0A438N471_EXOME|nr:hypothetical protein B0A52_05168 [Exophiala mesophila]